MSNTPSTTTLLTNKAQITQTQWQTAPHAQLVDGQVRVKIDHFAFTANNVTYAAFGDAMNYWQFFPQIEGWGCIPVWGYADVVESSCAGVEVGARYYGYYPFASHAVLQPERIAAPGFVDGAAHRKPLHALYNHYLQTTLDAGYAAELEAELALLKPLFITSFLIDDFLADNQFFGATEPNSCVVLSSASSKTAYGTAYALSRCPSAERPRIVGLTSAANVAFTQSLGLYDLVLSYDNIALLPATAPVVYVDMSGSATVRSALHTHCTGLVYSCAVGGTHWDDMKQGAALPGPRPTLFFAPAQMKKRMADWTPPVLHARIGEALRGFIAAATKPQAPWMKVEQHRGQAALEQQYQAVMAGKSSPNVGIMLGVR